MTSFCSKNIGLLFLCIFICTSSIHGQSRRTFFTGDNTDESEFNKIARSPERASRDLNSIPSSFSLKAYAPIPGDQGKAGTCVAWSSSYAARTISYCLQHLITDPAQIKAVSFSPNFIYYYVKQPGDQDCTGGAKVEMAMKVLTQRGDVLLTENVKDCATKIESQIDTTAKTYSIKAYSALTNTFGRISRNEVLAIKRGIAEKKPVIFSLKCFKSLFDVGKEAVWRKKENDSIVGNHAMCIVGFDDKKEGGAFEVMNSWGTEWGDKGFFWLPYDMLEQFGSYALELMDRESYEPAVTRTLGEPKLKGSLDLSIVDAAGNELEKMPLRRNFIALDGTTVPDPSKAAFAQYQILKKYQVGQRFKIGFTTNAPAFVYIFSIDDKKTISTLFPYAPMISPAISSTNATVFLPSEIKGYRILPGAQKDRLYILYSKSQIEFEKVLQAIQNDPDNSTSLLKNLFGKDLLQTTRIKFNESNIAFEVNAKENELICFFTDLEYQ